MKKIALIALMLLFSLPVDAANYYIAQTAAGSGNGSSCANAKAYSWNWTSPTVAGDDTVWICGTISGTETGAIIIPTAGTESHPITIKFCSETDCGAGNTGKLSAAYPPDSGFIWSYYKDNLVIDGNYVGIIEATDNGSQLGNQVGNGNGYSHGISIFGSHIEIKNLTIRNLYVHTYQTDTADNLAVSSNDGIYLRDGHAWSVHGVTISDTKVPIFIVLGAGDGYDFYNNKTSRSCWGMGGGLVGAGSTMTGLKIHNNEFEAGANWMSDISQSGPDCHLNWIYLWGNSYSETAVNDGILIYNNYFHGPFENQGGNFIASRVATIDYTQITNAVFFNNLFVAGPYFYDDTLSHAAPSNGIFGGVGDIQFYNNTVIGGGSGRTNHGAFTFTKLGGGGASKAYNNIVKDHNGTYAAGVYGGYDMFTPVVTTGSESVPLTDYNINYNYAFYGLMYLCNNVTCHLNTDLTTFALWKAKLATLKGQGSCAGTLPAATPTDIDCNSLNSNPLLNTNYTLQDSSPARGAATNLTALCSTIPALCYSKPLVVGPGSDTYGTPRPATGNWDIGAYEYVEPSGTFITLGGSGTVTRGGSGTITIGP